MARSFCPLRLPSGFFLPSRPNPAALRRLALCPVWPDHLHQSAGKPIGHEAINPEMKAVHSSGPNKSNRFAGRSLPLAPPLLKLEPSG